MANFTSTVLITEAAVEIPCSVRLWVEREPGCRWSWGGGAQVGGDHEAWTLVGSQVTVRVPGMSEATALVTFANSEGALDLVGVGPAPRIA